jgi:hypothetical protein
MTDNNTTPALNFAQSVEHNLEWIKQLAIQHECSGGMAAHAALMTMTMMDHHKMLAEISELQKTVTEIKDLLCQSNS